MPKSKGRPKSKPKPRPRYRGPKKPTADPEPAPNPGAVGIAPVDYQPVVPDPEDQGTGTIPYNEPAPPVEPVKAYDGPD